MFKLLKDGRHCVGDGEEPAAFRRGKKLASLLLLRDT